jgi:hypothetical protein
MCAWIVRSVEWQYFTEISGQRIGPILTGQEVQDGTDRLSRNVGTELSLQAA